MKRILKLILFLMFLVFSLTKANASHMMGAEIVWTCVGQDSFMVKFVLYRDCNSQTPGAGSITFKCATNGASITSLGLVPGTPIDITPVCKTIYTRCQTASCSFPLNAIKHIY